MRTVKCDNLIAHPDGVIEVRFSDTEGKGGAITFTSDAEFAAWMEQSEAAIGTDHLLAMAMMPAYRAGILGYDNAMIVVENNSPLPSIKVTP